MAEASGTRALGPRRPAAARPRRASRPFATAAIPLVAAMLAVPLVATAPRATTWTRAAAGGQAAAVHPAAGSPTGGPSGSAASRSGQGTDARGSGQSADVSDVSDAASAGASGAGASGSGADGGTNADASGRPRASTAGQSAANQSGQITSANAGVDGGRPDGSAAGRRGQTTGASGAGASGAGANTGASGTGPGGGLFGGVAAASVAAAMAGLVAPGGSDLVAAQAPPGFSRVMGYSPVPERLADGTVRLVEPDGACSGPGGGTSFGFDAACRAHDYGYDLLRYATAMGLPLPADGRRRIDDMFARDLRARCEATRDGIAAAGCRATAELFVAVVRLNSWRQGHGNPGPEPLAPWALGLPLPLVVAAPSGCRAGG